MNNSGPAGAALLPLRILQILAGLIGLVGAVVLYGWFTGNTDLTQLNPKFASMKFNTALLFVLLGSGIWLQLHERRRAMIGVALLVLLVAALTLLQHWLAVDVGIDQLLMRDQLTDPSVAAPGRMGLNTAWCFGLSALALLACNGIRHKGALPLMLLCGGLVTGVGLAALFGYWFAIDTAYGWSRYAAMSVHSAVTFCVVGMALVLLAWIRVRALGKGGLALLIIPVAMLLLSLNFTMWTALVSQQQHQERALTALQLDAATRDIQVSLKTLVGAMERMVRRWELHGGLAQDTWADDAQSYASSIDGVSAMVLVRPDNLSRVVPLSEQQWLQPLLKSESFTQLSLGKAKTIRAKHPHTGEELLLIQLPLVQGGEAAGSIVAVVTVDEFFNPVLERPRVIPLYLQVLEGGQVIYTYGSADQLAVEQFKDFRVVKLYGLDWVIEVSLLGREEGRIDLASLVLVVGLLISVLLLGALYFAFRSVQLNRLMQEKNKNFQAVVESAPCGMLVMAANGRIELVNAQVERMFGYSRQELLGQPVEMLIPEKYRHAHPGQRGSFFSNPTARAMGAGRGLFGQQKNGIEFPLEIGLSPISSEKGTRVLASIVNLSEREKYLAELERSNKELDNFAYVASHDLKSPLRGVDQLATWLSEDLAGKLDADSAAHLSLMRVRINRMERLLDDLLAYSRAGRKEAQPEPVVCEALIRDVFELCNSAGKFELQLQGEYPQFTTARAALELVLRNLISNAVKHHERGQGEIGVTVSRAGRFFQFDITDNGPGIPAEHAERVFAMFQTLRPRDEVEGSGMGLAIVRKTVEAFGGKIDLVINDEPGAHFRFTWPVEPA